MVRIQYRMTGGVDKLVVLGRISGVFGVRGWVKIFSYTEPRENILEYDSWQIGRNDQWRIERVASGKPHGKGVVAQITGYEDRDAAAELVGREIAVRRDQLPAPEEDEYYWADLEGLRVRNLEGVELGLVDHLIATGANDVMVVKGDQERLIPFVLDQVVTKIQLDEGLIEVDWDPEF